MPKAIGSSGAIPEREHVWTLHRYFIWSVVFREHYEASLGLPWFEGNEKKWTDEGIRGYAYLSHWYASLYVVIEGWKKMDLSDSAIDQLLESPNVKQLELFRHGVFHFHEDYFNKHLTMPLIDSQHEPVAWVRLLSSELGRWFQEWFASRRAADE